jgi:tRNA modification GTPase
VRRFTLKLSLTVNLIYHERKQCGRLISSDNEASRKLPCNKCAGFSNEIAKLREELLNFASLIELELDFAEEDVEFADRTQFHELLNRIEFVLKRLIDSFAVGNVIKAVFL